MTSIIPFPNPSPLWRPPFQHPQRARFYLHPPHAGVQPADAPIARLLGNRVLLLRVILGENGLSRTNSGLFIANTYQRDITTFKVLALGPGRWIKRGKRSVWIEPQCQQNDFCLSDHWTKSPLFPSYHQPHWLDSTNGEGRVILDARFIISVWNQD